MPTLGPEDRATIQRLREEAAELRRWALASLPQAEQHHPLAAADRLEAQARELESAEEQTRLPTPAGRSAPHSGGEVREAEPVPALADGGDVEAP